MFRSSLRLSEENFQDLSMNRSIDSQLDFLKSLADLCLNMAESEMKSGLVKIFCLVKKVRGGDDAMMKYIRVN